MADQLTDQEIKDMQTALPMLRAFSVLEGVLGQAERFGRVAREVETLEARKAGLAGAISAEQAKAVHDLERSLEASRAAAAEETARLLAAREGAVKVVEGRLESLRRDEERLREGLAATKTRLEGEIASLKETIRAMSEASAKAVADARRELDAVRATQARERDAFQAEKQANAAEVARLQGVKADLARTLKAAAG